MNWISKRQDLINALDEISERITKTVYARDLWFEELSEQIGELRSLVDHLPEDKQAISPQMTCTLCGKTGEFVCKECAGKSPENDDYRKWENSWNHA